MISPIELSPFFHLTSLDKDSLVFISVNSVTETLNVREHKINRILSNIVLSPSMNKLQSSSVLGDIFDGPKLTRPLTIEDSIEILIEHDNHLHSELSHLITSIQFNRWPFVKRRLRIPPQRQPTVQRSEFNPPKVSPSFRNDSGHVSVISPTPVPASAESIHEQHIDFMKKYRVGEVILRRRHRQWSRVSCSSCKRQTRISIGNDAMKR